MYIYLHEKKCRYIQKIRISFVEKISRVKFIRVLILTVNDEKSKANEKNSNKTSYDNLKNELPDSIKN